MNKIERIKTALRGEAPDRPPYGFWTHMPEIDHDPIQLAKATAAFAARLDLDFVKSMPNGFYCVEDWGCELDFSEVARGGTGKVVRPAVRVPADWATLAALNLVHVPYKGAVPAFVDLTSGQVQAMFITTAAVHPHVVAGRARVLAVASRKRVASFSSAPTLTESGIPGLEVPVWAGVLTTARTPAPIVDLLHNEMRAALQLPDVRQRLDQLGSEIAGDGPAAFARLLTADFARWAKVIKGANLKLD